MVVKLEDSIREKFVTLLANKFKISPDKITDDCSLAELGVDSADMVDVVFELEDTFDIQIEDDELVEYTTLSKIIVEIKAKIEQKGQQIAAD